MIEIESRLALTFDDISIVPGFSDTHPNEVDLRTRVCRGINLNIPILSAAMGESGVTALTGPVLSSLAYQIVIVAFASYLTWFWLIASYPAGKLAAFSFLTPLFGLVAGGVLLGERISAAMVAAMLLVCFGIYLVNRRPAAR